MKLPELTRMTIEEFESKSNDWFIVKDENYSRFHNYFSWEEMDSYMNSNGLNGHDRFPQLQVIDKKSGRKYCHKKAEQKMTKQDIFKKWKEGSSFVLPLSEHLNKQCWNQCKDFEEYYGRGQSNIYMSGQKDARCFPTHADTTANFLFHVRGTVRWYIMNEYEHECKPQDATVDKCIDLSEGDLLFLPPKLYHRVDTLGPRISISFHFHAPSERKHWREEWLDWIGDINGAAK